MVGEFSMSSVGIRRMFHRSLMRKATGDAIRLSIW